MTSRIPNTYSPVEVRQAISRLRLDSDGNQASIDAIDLRVEALEDVTPDFYSGEAVETVAAGMPVYGVAGSTSVGVARGDTTAKARVIGIAKLGASSGFAVTYLSDGRIELTDWTTVIGSASLTPNSVYYLNPTGGLTSVAPTSSGVFLVEVGRAVSNTTLDVEIQRPILL